MTDTIMHQVQKAMEAANSARPLLRFDYGPLIGCKPSHRHTRIPSPRHPKGGLEVSQLNQSDRLGRRNQDGTVVATARPSGNPSQGRSTKSTTASTPYATHSTHYPEVNPTEMIRLPLRFGDKMKARNLEVKTVITPCLLQLHFEADDGSVRVSQGDQCTARECYLVSIHPLHLPVGVLPYSGCRPRSGCPRGNQGPMSSRSCGGILHSPCGPPVAELLGLSRLLDPRCSLSLSLYECSLSLGKCLVLLLGLPRVFLFPQPFRAALKVHRAGLGTCWSFPFGTEVEAAVSSRRFLIRGCLCLPARGRLITGFFTCCTRGGACDKREVTLGLGHYLLRGGVSGLEGGQLRPYLLCTKLRRVRSEPNEKADQDSLSLYLLFFFSSPCTDSITWAINLGIVLGQSSSWNSRSSSSPCQLILQRDSWLVFLYCNQEGPPTPNLGGQRRSHTSNSSLLSSSQWSSSISTQVSGLLGGSLDRMGHAECSGGIVVSASRITKLYPPNRKYFFSRVVLFRKGVTFRLGECVLGLSRGSEREGAPRNTSPSATTSRTSFIWVCPLFLSTALPGASDATRDEELIDVPYKEELADVPPEEELTDVPPEEELADVPAEEEPELGPFGQQLIRSPDARGGLSLSRSLCLDISHKVSSRDFSWIRNLFLNTKDAGSGRILATRPQGSARFKNQHRIANLFGFPKLIF
ncbi:hypothetical protein Cgig2_003514 [Carnegiea gigantea]|uniref:Uncharacterized protein n=1 Tax=Carnegiea gigantea TaxID=171969 RepID=A0A9Q1Q6C4_9CARY|nr:hypothetical protein Cgig2_003514 [Carnegiea gigantea]